VVVGANPCSEKTRFDPSRSYSSIACTTSAWATLSQAIECVISASRGRYAEVRRTRRAVGRAEVFAWLCWSTGSVVAAAGDGLRVGGIDTARKSVHGLAGPRKPVELRHPLRHPIPELRSLRVRDAGVPDETPQLPVPVGGSGLPSGDLEVVEVPRHLLAPGATLDRDVEHP